MAMHPLAESSRRDGKREFGGILMFGLTSEQRACLDAEARPMAILLLAIAKADGAIAAEEIEVLASIIRETSERLGFLRDDEAERDLLANLLEIEPSPDLITKATTDLMENDGARAEFPKWVAG